MYTCKKLCVCIAAALIGIVLVICAGPILVSVGVLKLESSEYAFFALTAIVVVMLSLVALGLVALLLKRMSDKSVEEVRVLLEQLNCVDGSTRHSGNGNGEFVAAFEGLMSRLSGSLQSVRLKLHEIDGSMEVLSRGIHQVAADQTNLFSLSAEVEAARAHRDGFSIITNEVLSLAERTRHLTNAIRGAANQLRTKGNEAIVELEHVISRVDSNQVSSPTETITYANVEEGTGKTVSVTVSED